MLKCILLLLSEYYYGIVAARWHEICQKVGQHHVSVRLEEVLLGGEETLLPRESTMDMLDGISREETLAITDEPEVVRHLLEEGWYVVVLYHEKNQEKSFPAVRYGVEDIFSLEYRSYEEVFQRLAGLPWNILETSRLKIRETTVEDVEEFYKIYREPSVTLYMEDLYEKKEEEVAYIRAYIDQVYGFYGYGLWTVVLKETGQVIGRAGLSVRQGYEVPELGFLIDVPHQRQGYCFEACQAILYYAREGLGFQWVQALVDEKNLISQKLLRKLGFVFERNVSEGDSDYELFIKKL